MADAKEKVETTERTETKISAYIRRPDGHSFVVYPVKNIEDLGQMILVVGPDDRGYMVSPINVMFVREAVKRES